MDAVTRHSITFYEALRKESKEEKELGIVFRGKLTETFRETGISMGYYSPVLRSLKDNDCIEQLSRAGRYSETIIVLKKAPDPETYEMSADTGKVTIEDLARRVKALEESIGGMNVVEAFVEVERRLMGGTKIG